MTLPHAVSEGDRASDAAPRPSIADAFDPSNNSLNFIRLALAVLVVVSHCGLGGLRDPLLMHHTTVGIVAVYGFFAISGYLIAKSASRNNFGRFLWLRAIRIFPAFWVCLIVTAFGFGLVAWLHGQAVTGRHCGLSCYIASRPSPLGYIGHNFFLRINQSTISTTLQGVPWPYEWNVSIWTLIYEFACYLILAVLAILGLLRRRHVVLVLVACLWSAEIAVGVLNPVMTPEVWSMLTLAPVFMTGTLLYLYRDRLPDSGLTAIALLILYAVSPWTPFGGAVVPFRYSINAAQVAAPLLAYPIFWIGIHLPLQRVGARNDYSYGTYVYASPVQQLLAVFGLQKFGYLPYLAFSLIGTAPLALASWWLIEKHALRLRRIDPARLMWRGGRIAGS